MVGNRKIKIKKVNFSIESLETPEGKARVQEAHTNLYFCIPGKPSHVNKTGRFFG